jgi:signal peptidase II
LRTTLPARFAWWSLAVIACDQASKLVVHRTMSLQGEPIRVLGDVLRLTYIQNAGAAFGLFHGSRWFFIAVSLLSMLVLLSLALHGRHRDPLLLTAFGLIFGGALGNLIDRLWLGVVIDFIQMGIAGHYWPVDNVADIGVSVGVGLLALRLLLDRDVPSGAAPEDSA